MTLVSAALGFALSLALAPPRGVNRAAPAPDSAAAVALGGLDAARGFRGPELSNRAAYVPAQCYAKTRDAAGKPHNGCYVCHQDSQAPNYVDDADVQTELSLPRYATENRWRNLLSPPPPAALSEDELLAYVRRSNYFDADGAITLVRALAKPPAAWDSNGDGKWSGFVPDARFNFDVEGFDHDSSGKATGWRAYTSLPLPGAFMPTNGSMGDVLIRLPEPYRQDAVGAESREIYRINLAIVEAYVRRVDVPIPPVDERALGSDLDGDGSLGKARRIAFIWPPKPGGRFHYVGKAAGLEAKRDGWPVAGSLPRGTELLHSVRYLDVVGGNVKMAPRMKELRYMKKTRWLDYGQLDQLAQAEAREKFKSPDKLKHVFGDAERGVTTGIGWLMQGFIEDASGVLRPQNIEETTACIGCHGGVGATTDATFTLARKLPAGSFHDGWFHPAEHDLRGVADPLRADGQGEYAHYLAAVGGGDDFRSNDEVRRHFFRPDGSLDAASLQQLERDVSVLLLPSPGRALALDRAYLGLVRAQRFEQGRDVTSGAPPQLEPVLVQDAPTGITTPLLPGWKKPEPVARR
ncbi:MAG TPA: hypothetical protein VHB79_27330 [Polyangiaceae bacterium]|nr:hypothetical protein [Polyangiaceae bacterium]